MRCGTLLLAVLAGCGPLAAERPYLVIEPEILRLPGVRQGCAGSARLRLQNLGDGSLEVRDLHLQGPASITLGAPLLPATVLPGGELALAVSYAPPGGGTATDPPAAGLWIETSDLLRPTIGVEVQTIVGPPLLVATPSAVEFGPVASGTTATRSLRLQNVGLSRATDLRVDWMDDSSAELSTELPAAEIPAGGVIDVAVRYTPRGGDRDHGLLRLRWCDGARLVPVSGWQDLTAPD
jgi:hypothetical protein